MAPASNETTTTTAATTAMAQTNGTSNNTSKKNNDTPPHQLDGPSTTTNNNMPSAAETTGGNSGKSDDSSATQHQVDDVVVNTTSNHGGSDLERTLYRLTRGIPKSELRLMVSEADECEKALREEIAIMEQALTHGIDGAASAAADAAMASTDGGGGGVGEESTTTTIHTILESPYTPMDRFWTYSALVGRLRGDVFAIPSLFALRDEKHPDHVRAMDALEKQQQQQQQSSQPTASAEASSLSAAPEQASSSTSTTTTVSVKSAGRPATAAAAAADANSNNRALLALMDSPAYHRIETSANILACWKKIFTNRAAIVFKKAVKPEEAPGYVDRILFPIDLSLIRKMIVTRHIQSYATLHQYIALISHNCCKYNGRESDYGIVARDFEGMADHIIRTTVSAAHAKQQQQEPTSSSTATAATTATATAVTATVSRSVDDKMPPRRT
jgi:Bromodomain